MFTSIVITKLILQSLVEIVELGDGEIVSWTIWASNNSHLLDKKQRKKAADSLDPQQGIPLCEAATRWNEIVTHWFSAIRMDVQSWASANTGLKFTFFRNQNCDWSRQDF